MIENALTVAYGLVVTLPSLYLAFLAGATFGARPAPPRRLVDGPIRFAILVPAHNEELLIGRTVAALRQLDYPAERFAIHVVADNCTDDTARVARQHGACVHERNDTSKRGKGAALNWLVRELADEAPLTDALVVVDADSDLSPHFLSVMSDHLRSGADIVQGLNLVRVSEDRPVIRIRELALELSCHLRPLAYTRLGGSSGLYGNGVCLIPAICRRYPWSESSVVEDGELFIRLVQEGHRVAFASGAVVRSVMPATLRDARSQSVRWERARFDHVRDAAQFVWRGVRHGDPNALFAGLALLHPPAALLAAAGVLGVAAGTVAGVHGLAFLAAVSLIALAAYILRGAWLGGMGPHVMLKLALWAPRYTGWKVWVMALAALGVDRGEWVRTRRAE
jgi:cellulose synthase/poly-beta-1,6-N-acetylglucosamine synthase-like glycosyltransferase